MAQSSRLVRPRLVIALAASLVAAYARPAHAWTEARVTTAAATITVGSTGHADVDLELGLGIDAGWLEGLEIAGLDPDLVLDSAHPVVLVGEDGQRFEPAVRALEDGRVQLSFARRDAPRRGRYRTRIRYGAELAGRAAAPTGRGTVRFEWTLPGWQSGLDGVTVQIVAPPGATLPPDQVSAQASIRADVRATAAGSILSLRRAHLPRTLPWTVAFEVPESSLHESLRGPRAHDELPPAMAPAPREPALPVAMKALVLLFAAAAIAKRAAYDRAVRARGAAPRPLVPVGRLVHAIAVIACASAAAWLGDAGFELFALPLVAIVALSLQRRVSMVTSPRLGAFHPARPEHFAAARRARLRDRLEPLRFLDASEPSGAIITALAIACIFFLPSNEAGAPALAFGKAHGAALFAVLMLTSPATRLPATPELRLDALIGLATRLRAPLSGASPAMALRLVVHEDADGRAQDARLRICTEHRPEGLVRLDLVRLDRDGLGGHRTGHALLVVTRAGTPAERAVASALPRGGVQRAPAGRRARLASIRRDLEPVLVALAAAARPAGARPEVPRSARAVAAATLVAEPHLVS